MTVSTITGLPADVKRTLEQQNRTTTQIQTEQIRAASTLPTDRIETLPSAAPIFDFNEAVRRTQQQNAQAAASVLSDADIDAIQSQETAPDRVAAQPNQSVAAQATKLPADLLALLNE
jgi:hypothetical protein